MSVVQPVGAGQTELTQLFTLAVPATAPSNSLVTSALQQVEPVVAEEVLPPLLA